MLYIKTQHERQKAALAIVLLMLFSFQSVVATTEMGTLDFHSPEIANQPCTDNCIDHHYKISDVNSLLPSEDDKPSL